VGLRPPTANLATTATFGIATFILIHALGLIEMKKAYLKDYISPSPLMLPLNLIGELSKPISLSFRLFGNLLGGMIIIGTMYNMLPVPARFIIPNIGHIWFDIFVGFLQTFIFVMLSMTFISQKAVAVQ
jgi:F-type H+-transporting ATPase subunit a